MAYWTMNKIPEVAELKGKEKRALIRTIGKLGRQEMGNTYWFRLAVVILVMLLVIPLGAVLSIYWVQTPMIDAGLKVLRQEKAAVFE
ncbi:hypothetical protein [Halocynthiibacter sp.]|uniref:hypothetical protein n=1 Tax=Halocynthiibacter sp. TaxID=1979210 RepID=UPI003C58609D